MVESIRAGHAFSRHLQTLARRQPSAFLFAAQLISLILYALLEGVPGGRVLLGAFGTLVLVLVVWVVIRSPAVSWVGFILAAPALLLSLLSWLFVHPNLAIWAAVLEAALYLYGAAGLITYMMRDERVTIDELFAAGATFTLLAWGFAYLYTACQAWSPASFAGGIHPTVGPRTFIEMLFLSFTNLSATGLSDILPITPPARALVMLEQFAGVAYIAVVVSRLIGLTIVRERNREAPQP
ncbi:MAG: two pore domain potassium channel family protein [Deltaproteobacteria bacterium]|nr:two pore domain potassium channel family protein [Deltaproteobacteria bacterium]